MKSVSVGIIGAGFSASLQVEGIRKVFGPKVSIAAVAATSQTSAGDFARRHGISTSYADYVDLLADATIDVVCICVPNSLHAPVILAAARAGKHIICEKPLTGAFGALDGDVDTGRAAKELALVRHSLDELESVVRAAGVLFMYAENWVYAPAMTKTKRLLGLSGGRILDIRAEESHSGSHASRTRKRATAGGGALLSLGSHPIGAAIHLKDFESQASGAAPITVQSVTANVASFDDPGLDPDRGWLVSDWEDVERWSNVVLDFSDGSRAAITASFAMLGGVRNLFEVYTTNAVFRANVTPNDGLLIFSPDAKAFGDEYLHEKVESRAGWISASPDEDWARGYPQEMQDFIECVAAGRQPVSGLALARQVVEVIYASYVSAEQGRRIDLTTSLN
ncbi:MAG TPA: Gfo/Idh/MocA family oxidoreductase [Galbitalea sp.]|nr:Gfo/Idh/MocA family oxidoreductase [Galbitalea sp.]